MSLFFRCYDPLNAEPDEAKVFWGFSPEEAARTFAEYRHRDDANCDENDIAVIDETGAVTLFSVSVDWSPTFSLAKKAVTP